ncbi:MAG TPA: ABC transporter ATP-binding protein [Myxococcales bacterium]|nr:ABC transporter ATP-binding protein [Myxococcales bacterium]HET9752311.1 ABC transporter ATP-binding protein [Myxococcales bacterium]
MKAPLLQVDGISAGYGVILALHEVSLSVKEGELIALVGANGAGKTTLLHTISGVLKARSGRIFFDGRDVTRLGPEQRVRLGISQVPEGRQVFGPMSVEDNLRLGAYTRPSAEARQEMERMYAMFPALAGRRAQAAGTLSGGQQQMLAVARALMARPRLLLLDEPSMGLAPQLVGDVFRRISALARDGTTILLVEQNAQAALAIADHAYVIETGRTVMSGGGADLLRDQRVRRAYLGM